MCGAETRGPERASAELFDGATWFLTPSSTTSPERFRLVHGFVTALGGRPVAIDPGAHDRLVAVTSHLPHALANVLLNQAGASRVDGHDPLAAAGGSLRDMTRIAGANPRIWVDIFLDNREALAAGLTEHRRRVEQLESALAAGDAGFLARWIAEAGGNRRRLLATAYEDPGGLQQLRVHIPDRPGVLAGIFQALGAERINVEDFEMEHLSTERGGTLTVLVAGEAEAERAVALLEAQGYGVVVGAGDRTVTLVEPAVSVRGALEVPGVKGICQRGVLLGAIAEGETEVRGFGRAADTESAISVARQLGAEVIDVSEDVVRVQGRGLHGLSAPSEPLDCGNAGTVMRLVAGILAGQEGAFTLVGDESLSSRPQERIAVPLREMGAAVETTEGHAPVTITGAPLSSIRYELPVASAQVKSAILLAGLFTSAGPTEVVEPSVTRDHTERMLAEMGARVTRAPGKATVWPVDCLRPLSIDVPGDISSAAAFIAAATLLPDSELHLRGVNVNPTRTGILDVVERMGGRDCGLQPAHRERRARRRSRRETRGARRHEHRCRGGSTAGGRAAALLPARVDGARRQRRWRRR